MSGKHGGLVVQIIAVIRAFIHEDGNGNVHLIRENQPDIHLCLVHITGLVRNIEICAFLRRQKARDLITVELLLEDVKHCVA